MKTINDTAGHLGGDQALAIAGKCLRDAVRTTDVVGRYGGDEFAILLPQTPEAGAERVARRILQLVSGHHVSSANGSLPLTISIGLAVLDPSSGDTVRAAPPNFSQSVARELFARADEGLYRAKREGRNRLSSAGTLLLADIAAPDDGGASPTIAPGPRG
jgi:diguanylate cyclase